MNHESLQFKMCVKTKNNAHDQERSRMMEKPAAAARSQLFETLSELLMQSHSMFSFVTQFFVYLSQQHYVGEPTSTVAILP